MAFRLPVTYYNGYNGFCGVNNNTTIITRNNYYGFGSPIFGNGFCNNYGFGMGGGCEMPGWAPWLMGGMALTGLIGGIANIFGKGQQTNNCGCYQQYQQPGYNYYQPYYQQPYWGGGYGSTYQNSFGNQNAIGSQSATVDAKNNLGSFADNKDIKIFIDTKDNKAKYYYKDTIYDNTTDVINAVIAAKNVSADLKTKVDDIVSKLASNPADAKAAYDALSTDADKKAVLAELANNKAITPEQISALVATGKSSSGNPTSSSGSKTGTSGTSSSGSKTSGGTNVSGKGKVDNPDPKTQTSVRTIYRHINEQRIPAANDLKKDGYNISELNDATHWFYAEKDGVKFKYEYNPKDESLTKVSNYFANSEAPESEITYKDGTKKTETHYYQNGQHQAEWTFNNDGTKSSQIQYYQNGQTERLYYFKKDQITMLVQYKQDGTQIQALRRVGEGGCYGNPNVVYLDSTTDPNNSIGYDANFNKIGVYEKDLKDSPVKPIPITLKY